MMSSLGREVPAGGKEDRISPQTDLLYFLLRNYKRKEVCELCYLHRPSGTVHNWVYRKSFGEVSDTD
jgi:hypothetical protein